MNELVSRLVGAQCQPINEPEESSKKHATPQSQFPLAAPQLSVLLMRMISCTNLEIFQIRRGLSIAKSTHPV